MDAETRERIRALRGFAQPQQTTTSALTNRMRPDGSEKGYGYFGEIIRPDGNKMTEISIGVGFEGKETLIPLIVPTLNKNELDYLARADPNSKMFMLKMPRSIMDKAIDHARMRMKENKSPFANFDENVPIPK
jgi:hypothetical protein